jgi:hypothetical protein
MEFIDGVDDYSQYTLSPIGGRVYSFERAEKFLKSPDMEHKRQMDYQAMRVTVIYLLQNA